MHDARAEAGETTPPASAALKAAGRECAFFALYILLTIWMTWPLARHLPTAVPDPGDAYVSTYVMSWDHHATFSHDALFDAPIFYPARLALAFSEHLIGIAAPLFPFYAAGLAPITIYNLGVLLAFAFSGYGAFVLCRVVTRSTLASIGGGCFFAFVPYRFTQFAHISYTTAGWLALLLAAAVAYVQRPTRLRASLLGLAFFANGLACLHWLVLGGAAVALAVPVVIVLFPAARRVRFWVAPSVATAAAMLALVPFLIPYERVRSIYGMVRTPEDVVRYSAHVSDWLIAGLHLAYGPYVNDGKIDPELWLFPGIVPLLMAALWAWSCVVPRSPSMERGPTVRLRAALVAIDAALAAMLALAYLRAAGVLRLRWDLPSRAVDLSGPAATPLLIAATLLVADFLVRRRLPAAPRPENRRPLALVIFWGVLAFIGSLGVNAPLHPLLYRFVSPFRGIRVPARWSMIVYAALAVIVAAACARLIAGKSAALRVASSAAIAAAILLEQHTSMRYYHATAALPETYSWITSASFTGGIFEIPFRESGSEYRYMLAAASHLRPMLNGVSSFEPADRKQIEEKLHTSPVDLRLVPLLRSLGASILVVHADHLGGREEDVRRWLAGEVKAGRLVFLRHFCSGARGDYVFALAGESPAVGHAAAGNGDLLAPESSPPCGGIAGALTAPAAGADVRGGLVIEGWASAPEGVRDVFARFDGGSVRVPLSLQPPANAASRAAFRGTIPQRPADLPRDTDVQIEILSRSGRVMMLDDAFLTWRDRAEIRWYDWQRPALYELASRMQRSPDFARAILGSDAPVNLIARTIVRDGRRKADAEFLRETYATLLSRAPDPVQLGGRSRFEFVKSIICSDEFARAHLVTR